ncbi:MAG TPA: site-2 protease family protein [Myxococcota bacterium]|nr:site-2 protease family protein [Myxococcota bacterium]
MKWSYDIGRLFGFPIRMHVSLVIFLAFVLFSGGGLYGLALMIAVFASVVLHELGHALTARRLGVQIVDISLYPFGGMARMAANMRTSSDEIEVALMGPATSLALAAILGILAWVSASGSLWMLAKINLMLGVFNLLPALPMDGGRVFRAYLARRMGFYRATAVSARLARWLAASLAVLGLFTSGWLIVLAAFLLFMSLVEQAAARAREFMGDPGYDDTAAQAHRFDRRIVVEWRDDS